METLLSAIKSTSFRGMIDGRSFDADPFYPSAPAISADVPIMAGYTNTETTYHLRLYPGNFDLQYADVKRRLMRFLEIESAQPTNSSRSIATSTRNTEPARSWP